MFGAIIGAIGAISAGRRESAAAEAQGEVAKQEAEYNAQLYRNSALAIEQATEANTYQKLYYNRAFAAKQRLAQSSMGAMLDQDTPLLVAVEQLKLMSNNVNNFRRGKAIEVAFERSKANMTEFKGDQAVYLADMKANAIRRSSVMSAFGSLAGGIDGTIDWTELNPLGVKYDA